MAKSKFRICTHCGNFIGMIKDTGVPVICCGEPMKEVVANTEDAAQEKHVPVVNVDGDNISVNVGSVDHPMLEEHWINWIYVETEKGAQRKELKPGEKPAAVFNVKDDKAIAVYEYCNLHGLWKKDL